MSGVEEEQEEGGKTLSLMSFNYFLLAFLGGFQQHPGNRGRALSGSIYSLAGSQSDGEGVTKMGISLRSWCVVKTAEFIC